MGGGHRRRARQRLRGAATGGYTRRRARREDRLRVGVGIVHRLLRLDVHRGVRERAHGDVDGTITTLLTLPASISIFS